MATDIALTLPRLTIAAESGFTVTRLRDFVATTLSDATLQTLLDAAFAAIVDEVGPPGELEESFSPSGDLLRLSRTAGSVVSVTEDARYSALALAADDYELRRSGHILVRRRDGTNQASCWRGRIEVAYVPVDDTANRIRVATELVKLNISFSPGLASQTIGTWSETYRTDVPYPEQRAAILASLSGDTAWVR